MDVAGQPGEARLDGGIPVPGLHGGADPLGWSIVSDLVTFGLKWNRKLEEAILKGQGARASGPGSGCGSCLGAAPRLRRAAGSGSLGPGRAPPPRLPPCGSALFRPRPRTRAARVGRGVGGEDGDEVSPIGVKNKHPEGPRGCHPQRKGMERWPVPGAVARRRNLPVRWGLRPC